MVFSWFLIFSKIVWIFLFSIISDSLLFFFSNCYKYHWKASCTFLARRSNSLHSVTGTNCNRNRSFYHILSFLDSIFSYILNASIMFHLKKYKCRIHCFHSHFWIYCKDNPDTTKLFLSWTYLSIMSECHLLMHWFAIALFVLVWI